VALEYWNTGYGGRDWPGRGERHLARQEAAVHRHSLDRLNTINDSPPPKKKNYRICRDGVSIE